MVPNKYKIPTERFRKEIGMLIKDYRKKKNVSQEKLASHIGLSRTSINNIEHGRQRIMIDTLLMISDILKVPLIDFMPKEFEMLPSFDKQIPSGTSDSVKEWLYDVKDNK